MRNTTSRQGRLKLSDPMVEQQLGGQLLGFPPIHPAQVTSQCDDLQKHITVPGVRELMSLRGSGISN